ncbi:MAG: cyclic nucleotide-binding domain-containing protein, partial [Pseudomonadota bacterium]|nr:cyclic nucleotide-binding domain-containing protein [Pseudomonadota bacterium]
MSDAEQTRKSLKNIALFKDARDSFIANLIQSARIQKHSKGHVLFVNQDKAEKFYIVLNGWIKLFRETLDGAQAVVDILPAGHIFGETSIFED